VATFVVGDVHGHRDVLADLLRDAGLLDGADRWSGGDARLWLMGDLVDRGPDGIGALDLAMRLGREGDVRCLLGNHEVLLLGVDRFPSRRVGRSHATFSEVWLANGGVRADLRGLTDEHRAWIASLPTVAREGPWLLLHADTDRYLELGGSVDAVCATAGRVLATPDWAAHAHLFDVLCDRGRLADSDVLDGVLGALGGERVLHGHTPIPFVLDCDPRVVTEPLVYGGGRVLNVDHCLFCGGPGFVVEL
jgi:hypothetical protein